MPKSKIAFRKQSNSGKLYLEFFYVSRGNTTLLLDNSIVLDSYGDSSISSGGRPADTLMEKGAAHG